MNQKYKIILFIAVFICFCGIIFPGDFTFADRELESDYPEAPSSPDDSALSPSTTKTTLPEYVKYLFNLLIGAGGILAFTMFVFGGVMWLLSAGNPGIIESGKKKMFNGIMGLSLLLCSYLIIYTINPDITILRLNLNWVSTTGPEYTPSEPKSEMYQEIPIGLLIEDLLAKNISCFQTASAKMELIDCRTKENLWQETADEEKFNSNTHYNYCYQYDEQGNKQELLEYHDRLDCIEKLMTAIRIKSALLKEKSEQLNNLIKKCKCRNCNGPGSCVCQCDEDGCWCEDKCFCCGSPREETYSCSGNPPFPTLSNDPCPNRQRIDELRNEIHQLLNGKTQKIQGPDIVDNPDYNPLVDSKFLYLKEARKRLNELKQELNNDLKDLEQAEELAKFPSFVKRLNLSQYLEEKSSLRMDKLEFKNFSAPEYDSISTYCKEFNCPAKDNEICGVYELNTDGVLCNLFNLDGDPGTFYHSIEEYEQYN